jgi:hypothetical protein
LGIVLVTFVGVWLAVGIVGVHSLIIHGILDLLPRLIAPLGKGLLLVLLALAFVKVIGGWLLREYCLTVDGSLDLLPRLTVPLGKALLLVLLIMLGTALVRVVGSWMLGDDTITIASFTDMRPEGNREKGGGVGHTLTDALTFEIHRINQLYTLKNPWASAEEVPPLGMTGPQAYERVGTVRFVGVELPVGEVVLALRALWPSLYTRYVITGSLQNGLAGKTPGAHLSVRLEEDGRTRKHWNHDIPLDNEKIVKEKIQELAYQILWSTLKDIETTSLDSFRNFVEGVALFRRYKDKKMYTDFVNAETYFLKAIGIDEKYARAYFYLGNLYNWRAHFADLESQDEKCYREEATKYYKKAGDGYAANPYEAKSFMNFGMGLVYHRAYSKRKDQYQERIADKLSELNEYLTKAHEYYTKVTGQEQNFYFAQTGRGLIYKEKADLSSEDPQEINTSKVYMHCAVQELRHAKYIAVDRKDKESLRWLDRHLHDLERKSRDHNSNGLRLQAILYWIPDLRNKCLESDWEPSENVSGPAVLREHATPRATLPGSLPVLSNVCVHGE